MGIMDKRVVYKPFEYTQAHDYMKRQQQAHWLPEEVPLASDLTDFKTKLTEPEKHLIGNILKSFAQTETIIEDYWSSKVCKWFPKPEIRAMGVTLGSFESIHAEAYSLLNESLGLDDFEAFLEDETAMAKIEYLTEYEGDNLENIASSLAVFSAFTEGVNLFSSFAVLMSFQLRDLMKGVGQIVEFSVRDESLHSHAGCWLFNELCKENKGLREKIQPEIAMAADTVYKLEKDFIDKAFEMGPIEGITKDELVNFIRNRINNKLIELGYDDNILGFSIDKELLSKMEWFDKLTGGKSHTDFFASRVTDYSKSTKNWEDI